jgi:hypothetical protein
VLMGDIASKEMILSNIDKVSTLQEYKLMRCHIENDI